MTDSDLRLTTDKDPIPCCEECSMPESNVRCGLCDGCNSGVCHGSEHAIQHGYNRRMGIADPYIQQRPAPSSVSEGEQADASSADPYALPKQPGDAERAPATRYYATDWSETYAPAGPPAYWRDATEEVAAAHDKAAAVRRKMQEDLYVEQAAADLAEGAADRLRERLLNITEHREAYREQAKLLLQIAEVVEHWGYGKHHPECNPHTQCEACMQLGAAAQLVRTKLPQLAVPENASYYAEQRYAAQRNEDQGEQASQSEDESGEPS